MRPILGGIIPVVTDVVDGRAIVVPNTSAATYCKDSNGRVWIRKRVEHTAYEPLLAEALAWLLSCELKVPIPDAAILEAEGDELSWLSAHVHGVVHWDPHQVPFIHNLEGLGRTLALDSVLLNTDRHAGNILLQADPDQLRLMAWAIDFGGALVGHPSDFAAAGVDLPGMPSKNLLKGIPVELVRDGAEDLAIAASRLPPSLVRSFVHEACTFAKESKGQILEAALLARLAAAPELTDSYLTKISEQT